jgi:hypothetical protein
MALIAGELFADSAIFGFLFLCAAIYRAAMIFPKQMLLKRYLPCMRPAALTRDDLNGNIETCRLFFYLCKRCWIFIRKIMDAAGAIHPAGRYQLLVSHKATS